MEYTTIQKFGIRFYFKTLTDTGFNIQKPNKNNDIVKYYFQLKINYFIPVSPFQQSLQKQMQVI